MQIITIYVLDRCCLGVSRRATPPGGSTSQLLLVVDKQSPPSLAPQSGSSIASDRGGVRRIDVRELLGDRRELLIVHAGREYRLRVTSNGKLILTA